MARPRTPPGHWGNIRLRQTERGWEADGRYRRIDGTSHRHTIRGALSALDAEARLRATENEVAVAGPVLIDPSSTLETLAYHWLDVKARDPRIKPQSIAKYREQIATHPVPRLGKHRIGDVTTGLFEQQLQLLRVEASPWMANAVRGLLKQMCDHAIRLDALVINPVSATSRGHVEGREIVAYNASQIDAVRTAYRDWVESFASSRAGGARPSMAVLMILETQLATSMRLGEVLALRPIDFNFDEARPMVLCGATLVQATGVPLTRQEHPKASRQIRWIKLPDVVIPGLRALARAAQSAEAPLFPSRSGGWRSPHNVRRTVRDFRAAKAQELRGAGIDPGSLIPHAMRKSATSAVSQGLSIQAAADLAGHGDVAVTRRHYIIPVVPVIDGGQSEVLDALLRRGSSTLGADVKRSETALSDDGCPEGHSDDR